MRAKDSPVWHLTDDQARAFCGFRSHEWIRSQAGVPPWGTDDMCRACETVVRTMVIDEVADL